jgi:hypothetical protein
METVAILLASVAVASMIIYMVKEFSSETKINHKI